MSGYNNYRFLGAIVARGLRKAKQLKNPDTVEVTNFLLDNSPKFINTLDFLILAEEILFEEQSGRFLFPENKNLLEALDKAKVDIGINSAFLPYDRVCISFPNDYEICGRKPKGVCVSVDLPEERQKGFDWVCKQLNIPPVTLDHGSTHEELALGTVYINYKGEDDSFCRVSWNISTLSEIIGSDLETALTKFTDFDPRKNVNVFKVDRDEKIFQIHLLRTVVRLLIYCEAMPDKVRAGLPDSKAGTKNIKPIGQIVSLPESARREEGSKAPSFVSVHLRQLKDKRYYQGEHATKPQGSRFVFVKPHLRGMKDAHPETVEL